MIAQYYTQITFKRMAEILGYTIEVMSKKNLNVIL